MDDDTSDTDASDEVGNPSYLFDISDRRTIEPPTERVETVHHAGFVSASREGRRRQAHTTEFDSPTSA